MASNDDAAPFKVPEFKPPSLPPAEPKTDPAKESSASPAELLKARSSPLNYREPPDWNGSGSLPPDSYFIEEIKSGTIVKKHPLKDKTFFVIGRLSVNDIQLEHPSLSRHHAVVQYKGQSADPEQPPGFYLYDMGSTHGTYHNKNRCFPSRYYRLRVGHCLKFGGSTRLLILQGPDDDMEAESDLSVTELKAIAAEKARNKAEEQREKEEAENKRGVSWGMADDAVDSDEEEDKAPDMSRNPFSVIREGEGKELNLNDPKKTLRSWFEKEGFDQPDFKCSETGFAQFKCTLELPVDDETTGRPLVAEAEVKGKKKEAVVQCAMEACRMLDKAGMLRNQGSHESMAALRAKRLKEDDFYASDEDEFLDRTGTLEAKRKKRMKMLNVKVEEKSETFESLSKKSADLKAQIAQLQMRLEKAQSAATTQAESDDLDSYMAAIEGNADSGSKEAMSKLRLQLSNLQKEKTSVDKLVELTRPTKMPELSSKMSTKSGISVGKMFGSRPAGLTGPSASKTSEKPVAVSKAKPKAFLEEEDEELSAKPKLSSLEEFKKEIEQEKLKPDAAKPPKQEVAKPSKKEAKAKPPRPKKEPKPKTYDELSNEDDKYQTWVPPVGQTGDGRTSLNDKLGY